SDVARRHAGRYRDLRPRPQLGGRPGTARLEGPQHTTDRAAAQGPGDADDGAWADRLPARQLRHRHRCAATGIEVGRNSGEQVTVIEHEEWRMENGTMIILHSLFFIHTDDGTTTLPGDRRPARRHAAPALADIGCARTGSRRAPRPISAGALRWAGQLRPD